MWGGHWINGSQRLLVVFLVVMLVIAGTLGWLGWHLFEQDLDLSRRASRERQAAAAETGAAVVARKLSELEASLTVVSAPVETEDLLIVRISPNAIETQPAFGLPYYPFVSQRAETNPVFQTGESLEFREEYESARRNFQGLAVSSDPAIRAGALLRSARVLVKAGASEHALQVYREMQKAGPIPLEDGYYSDLVGRSRRIVLLLDAGRRSECEQESSSLFADLLGNNWSLERDRWKFYVDETRRCFQPDAGSERRLKESIARAEAVTWLWEESQRHREEIPFQRTARRIEDVPVLMVWRSSPEGLVAAVAGKQYLEKVWGAALAPISTNYHFSVLDSERQLVLGSDASCGYGSRSLADAQIPWTLCAEISTPDFELDRLATRRRWYLAGLGLAGVFILTGGVFVARGITREAEVGRLQSDFVSAVSHEFRTPLASIRQASELLADGRVSSDVRRQAYYAALRSEAERLQRLVEDLLDFRRMEAGVQQYDRQALSPEAFVRDVVTEFSGSMPDTESHIEVDVNENLRKIYGDPRALGRALRNLLENAVKYSGPSETVRVAIEPNKEGVAIHVRDRGIGIALSDQRKIFKKFVRTGSARAAGVKGTGLGLSMAHQIVVAHGGRILVSSEPGAGSTFTIILPAQHDPENLHEGRRLAT